MTARSPALDKDLFDARINCQRRRQDNRIIVVFWGKNKPCDDT